MFHRENDFRIAPLWRQTQYLSIIDISTKFATITNQNFFQANIKQKQGNSNWQQQIIKSK